MTRDEAKPWLGLLGAITLSQCGVAGPSLDGVYTANSTDFCATCGASSSGCQCCSSTMASGSSGGVPLVTLTISNSNAPSAQGMVTTRVLGGGSTTLSCNLTFTRSGNSLTVTGGSCPPLGGCSSLTVRATGGSVTVGDLVANADLRFTLEDANGCSSYSCSLSFTTLLSRR